MFTKKDLIEFGNYILSSERREHLLNNSLLSDQQKIHGLENVLNADFEHWKAITFRGLTNKQKLQLIEYNLEKAKNGDRLFFEHKGTVLSTPQIVAVLEAASKKGYKLIEEIPEIFVEKNMYI